MDISSQERALAGEIYRILENLSPKAQQAKTMLTSVGQQLAKLPALKQERSELKCKIQELRKQHRESQARAEEAEAQAAAAKNKQAMIEQEAFARRNEAVFAGLCQQMKLTLDQTRGALAMLAARPGQDQYQEAQARFEELARGVEKYGHPR